MTLDDYQESALSTLFTHPDPVMNQTILAMGVAGEAGEMLDKWKKVVAIHGGVVDEERLTGLEKEIGDVLWYLAAFADSLGLSLGNIAEKNLAKLRSRVERGTLKGDGDDR
jgi:NTP pyrophosphatase (non-canonical NTP hydrolase)